MTTEQSGPVGSDSSEGLGGGAPVAWGMPNSAITGSTRWMMLRENLPSNDQYGGALWTPLYDAPQPAERVPLTRAQVDACWDGLMPSGHGKSRYDIARAIEQAHGIRAAGVKEPGNAGNNRLAGQSQVD